MTLGRPLVSPGFAGSGPAHGRVRRRGGGPLLKKARPVAAIHYRSVRIRSNLDIKLGRVIGGWQWRAADRRCASRYGHSSRGASGLGVAFVGALRRRFDSQGVDPQSLNWKISSPGKARDRSPAPYLNNNICFTPVAGPAARWKPWWWRTAALGRPLEELLDLWAQTDWARVDCRLKGHERPGLRLSAHGAARSSGSGPTNAKSTGRPYNR
jgi:hypothetical protein